MDGTRRRAILVVDDHADLRLLVARALRQDYHVIEAGSGPEAIEQADRNAPPVDLLLTDIRMPGMNGPELARILTSRYPQLRLLYMSGYSDVPLGPEAPIVRKPFRLDALKEEIRRALGDLRAQATP